MKTDLIKFFYPRADKVVCVSKETEKILNRKYGVQNTCTIYNMMDIEKTSSYLGRNYQKNIRNYLME